MSDYAHIFSVGRVSIDAMNAGIVSTQGRLGYIDRPAVDVRVTYGDSTFESQYTGPSIEYGESESILRDAAVCVAYEFASYAVDPDEFTSLMIGEGGIDREEFERISRFVNFGNLIADEIRPHAQRLSDLFNRR